MQALIPFLVGGAVGAALGVGFFGGLWWTSRRLATHRRPALLVITSLTGRLALLAVGLVVTAQIGPMALVGAVAGLLAARHGWLRAVTDGAPSLSPTPGTRPDRGR